MFRRRYRLPPRSGHSPVAHTPAGDETFLVASQPPGSCPPPDPHLACVPSAASRRHRRWVAGKDLLAMSCQQWLGWISSAAPRANRGARRAPAPGLLPARGFHPCLRHTAPHHAPKFTASQSRGRGKRGKGTPLALQGQTIRDVPFFSPMPRATRTGVTRRAPAPASDPLPTVILTAFRVFLTPFHLLIPFGLLFLAPPTKLPPAAEQAAQQAASDKRTDSTWREIILNAPNDGMLSSGICLFSSASCGMKRSRSSLKRLSRQTTRRLLPHRQR